MASFTAFLEVGGKSYPLFRYELSMHQETDTLGRPASPVLGGTIICTLSSPGQQDPFLYQWMMSPTMQQDGKIRLLQDAPKATEKTISFFNAYCTGLDISFQPGQSGGAGSNGMPSSLIQIQINPQRVAVGAIVHDNNWPLASHGSGESFAKQLTPKTNGQAKKEEPSGTPPGAFSEGLHSVLDVVGMIPIIGEVADAANAAIYLAEGRYGEAALAAAAMIPLAGNVVGAAKIGRRGLQLIQKGAKLIPPKALTKLDEVAAAGKTLCTKVGHPVDVATGMLFTDAVDLSLPGPIALTWERTWYSASDHQGVLGYGWHWTYDMGLLLDADTNIAVFRMADGRQVAFEPPQQPDQAVYDRRSGLSLHRPLPDAPQPAPWLVRDKAAGLWYVFAPPATDGTYQPLHTIENATGQYISFQYRSEGRLAQLTDSSGRVLTVDYDEQGHITALWGPHPDQPQTQLKLVSYGYDAAGNLTSVTDAEGHITRYLYDTQHRLIQETNAVGLSFYFEYELEPQPHKPGRCVHTWGDDGIYDTKIAYVNEQTTKVWDSYDQLTTYIHQDGLVIEQTDPLGHTQQWVYDEDQRLLSEQNGLGQLTRYRYDERGNRLSVTVADGTSQYNDYDAADQLTAFVDGEGNTWQYSYQSDGLLSALTDPLGGTTRYEYDEQGRLTTVINALGQRTQLRYTKQHQIAHVVTPTEQIYSREYDALGRMVRLTDPTGAAQLRQYDRLGQVVQTKEADGSEQILRYDGVGNVVEVSNGEQHIQFSYTGQSRLAMRRQGEQQVTFQYDAEGRLTGLTNEAGLPYRFGLNAAGQVVEEEGFDGLLRRYERDAAGRLVRTLRPADRYTEYTYTPTGQIEQIAYSDGEQERYAYDANGYLIEAVNASHAVRLQRDALGRIVKDEQGDHWIAYQYDALGQRTGLTSSLGADLAISHDGAGNVSQLAAGSWQAQFSYNARGLELQRQLSGGVQVAWQRDILGRPTQQIVGQGQHSDRRRAYTWNTANQLLSLNDTQQGLARYEYDAVGTLTKASFTDELTEIRVADAVGNLYERADQRDRQYGPGGQLLRSEQADYQYDGEGNLTTKTTKAGDVWHYHWSANGTLRDVVRPDGARVEFSYDALGRRVSKRYKGKVTHWLWENNKPLHEWQTLELDGTNTNDVITWLFEEDSFTPLGKLQGTSRQSIVSDHLGTPLEMVDQGGLRTWSAQTTAYGRVRLEKGTRQDCPFRFQGQYEDVETGLYYNRFRYYAPETGAYISQDPIGLNGGFALYAYAWSPTTVTDPTGLAGVPSFAALKHMAQNTLDFSTAKDGAVFWSGSRMRDAQKWAAAHGKTTLEQTVGGKYLDNLDLFNAKSGLTGAEAAEIWNVASKRFADGASGTVNTFSTGAKRFGPFGERTWWRIEKPALLNNPNVDAIMRRTKEGLLTKAGHFIRC